VDSVEKSFFYGRSATNGDAPRFFARPFEKVGSEGVYFDVEVRSRNVFHLALNGGEESLGHPRLIYGDIDCIFVIPAETEGEIGRRGPRHQGSNSIKKLIVNSDFAFEFGVFPQIRSANRKGKGPGPVNLGGTCNRLAK
jgi:hypothetical protein